MAHTTDIAGLTCLDELVTASRFAQLQAQKALGRKSIATAPLPSSNGGKARRGSLGGGLAPRRGSLAPRRGSLAPRRDSLNGQRRGSIGIDDSSLAPRRGSLNGPYNGQRRGSIGIAGVVAASKFVHKFRQEHQSALHCRLQTRRGAINPDSIRLFVRRPAICSKSCGLVAHLDALKQEADMLRVTQHLLEGQASGGLRTVVPRLEEDQAASPVTRRTSMAIDWDAIRRDINAMPSDELGGASPPFVLAPTASLAPSLDKQLGSTSSVRA